MTDQPTIHDCYPIFKAIMGVLEAHHVSLEVGTATLAYSLGYARGLGQKPIMDTSIVQNIHQGWHHGASTDIADLILEEPQS